MMKTLTLAATTLAMPSRPPATAPTIVPVVPERRHLLA
jgi:hypothetical protein